MTYESSTQPSVISDEAISLLSAKVWTTIYICAIVAAEVWLALVNPLTGALAHAFLLFALLLHTIFTEDVVLRRAFVVLLLLPLLRILSLTMPLRNVHQMYWYLLIGAPLLGATLLTARHLEVALFKQLLPGSAWRSHLLVAASGIPLGLMAYWLARPNPHIATFNWPKIFMAMILLAMFVGLTEELLFRGLLLQSLSAVYGRTGLLWSALLFAGMHIGSLSIGYILLTAMIGYFYGWFAQRTGSLLAVVISHSIFSSGLLLIWPLIWR